MNASGELVITPRFDEWRRTYATNPFKGGYERVRQDEKWGMVNSPGRVIIEPMYEELSMPSEGRVLFRKDGKYGYADAVTGRVHLPAGYTTARPFRGGLAMITFGNKDDPRGNHYFIDRYGSIVAGPFSKANDFWNGLARVETTMPRGTVLRGYANAKGEWVWNTQKKKKWKRDSKVREETKAAKNDIKNKDKKAKALAFLEAQVKNGNPDAMLYLGSYYFGERDFVKARDLLEQAFAYDGITNGSYMILLGDIYALGDGVKVNGAKAMAWYKHSVNQGYIPAMSSLTKCYYGGKIVEKDHRLAAKWASRAMETGDMYGMYLYGYLLYRGHGVDKDQKTAIELLKKAARKGIKPAQEELMSLKIKW